jgi:hypothetical protein
MTPTTQAYLGTLSIHVTREQAVLNRLRSVLEQRLRQPASRTATNAALRTIQQELNDLASTFGRTRVSAQFTAAHATQEKSLRQMASAVGRALVPDGTDKRAEAVQLEQARAEVIAARESVGNLANAVASAAGVAAATVATTPIVGAIIAAVIAVIAAIMTLLAQLQAKNQEDQAAQKDTRATQTTARRRDPP